MHIVSLLTFIVCGIYISRPEALSRAVIVPIVDSMNLSPEEKAKFGNAKPYASKHFVQLMNLTDEDIATLGKRVADLTKPVEALLNDIRNAPERIAQNYCIVIAVAELVNIKLCEIRRFKPTCLQFLAKVGYAHWIPKVKPFVLHSTLPKALPYYTKQRESTSFLNETTSSQDDTDMAHKFCVGIKKQMQENQVNHLCRNSGSRHQSNAYVG